jgi:anhydro-N-acetylmuramic acid kinase
LRHEGDALSDFYIGLISGTSMDGIDAALVEFKKDSLHLVDVHAHAYPVDLGNRLRRIMLDPTCSLDEFGELHVQVGICFRDATLALLQKSGVTARDIRAIGSHGQTLRHRPDLKYRFSLQIGDAATIATGTGIDTVADFRSADIALGGEGAPLVPLFHHWLFADNSENRVVLNLGGIANLTVLPAGCGELQGFDTGPGNTLLDAWMRKNTGSGFDDQGAWAKSGAPDAGLLQSLKADSWFELPPPKSTGFEHFNLDWLAKTAGPSLRPADVQATLAELTAQTVAEAIQRWAPGTSSVLVCGGGVKNVDLMHRIGTRLPGIQVQSTALAGIDPDWVEAAAFAWLARQRLLARCGTEPSVTGASRPAILGAIYAH